MELKEETKINHDFYFEAKIAWGNDFMEGGSCWVKEMPGILTFLIKSRKEFFGRALTWDVGDKIHVPRSSICVVDKSIFNKPTGFNF